MIFFGVVLQAILMSVSRGMLTQVILWFTVSKPPIRIVSVLPLATSRPTISTV